MPSRLQRLILSVGGNLRTSALVSRAQKCNIFLPGYGVVLYFCLFCHPGVVQLENTVGVGRPSHISRNKTLRSVNPDHNIEKTKNRTYNDSHNTAEVYCTDMQTNSQTVLLFLVAGIILVLTCPRGCQHLRHLVFDLN